MTVSVRLRFSVTGFR